MDQYSLQQSLQSELLPGESLLWSGQPSRRAVFHRDDWFGIPFSLMWGGFAIFWTISAAGGFNRGKGSPFFVLWGIPFVVMGQYVIWGRFVYNWWHKARVIYAITSRRLLIVDHAWSRKVNAIYVDQIPLIEKFLRSDGIGTLRFGYPPQQSGRRSSSFSMGDINTSGVPIFTDIENAESVYSIVAGLREKATTKSVFT
jgi:hypothetical protein